MADLHTLHEKRLEYYSNLDFEPDSDNEMAIDPLLNDVLAGTIVAPTSHLGGDWEDVIEDMAEVLRADKV